jgi:hypothetical protein
MLALPIANVGPERLEAIVSRTKQVSKRKRRCKIGPVLGAAGLSLSLAGGVSAATAAPVADALTQNSVVSHEIITLDEEEIADVNLATFYVFDKENAGPSRHGVRLVLGYDPYVDPRLARLADVEMMQNLHDMLRLSQILVLVPELTNQTRNLIGGGRVGCSS